MTTTPFKDRARIDAVDKVRGATAYAADIPVPGMLYAMLVPSVVAKGRIATLHVEDAVSVPGVVRILTPDDFPPPPEPVRFPNADAPPTLHRDIAFRGQPIALVVAETLEAATEGAERVAATFETQPFAATKRSALAVREEARPTAFGDAETALAQATTTVDVEYESPAQHHNPIELISTTAVWTDGRLTIYEGTQFASGIKRLLRGSCGSTRVLSTLKARRSAEHSVKRAGYSSKRLSSPGQLCCSDGQSSWSPPGGRYFILPSSGRTARTASGLEPMLREK